MRTFIRRLALLAAFFCAFTARAQTVDGVVVDADDDEAIAPTLATVFSDNFEGGIGNWSADNGVWEVGTPTSGPNACHQGSQCAATLLGGDYPGDQSSRLISPAITLPTVTAKQDIQLRFWSWYEYAACDARYVQISVRDANGNWSGWGTLNGWGDYASTWSVMGVDLTAYAGNTIRFSLLHVASSPSGCAASGAGWYVDEFSVRVRRIRLSGSFDRGGWGDWSTDNGIWQVGTPAQGCHDGAKCAAVVLNGTYPADGSSRLVSPTIIVPQLGGAQEAQLRFWQRIDYAACDAGYVQIATRSATGAWSGWATLDSAVTLSSPWSLRSVDLTPYKGLTVRLGFLHVASSASGCAPSAVGWTIDTVLLAVFTPTANNTDFESGWNGWWADNGIWQIGAPTSGPSGCTSGTQCAATILDGDYPADGTSRLISPPIALPTLNPGQEVEVRFMHWFAFGACDAGYVQVQVRNATSGAWSGWATVGAATTGASSWTTKAASLTPWAGSTVRVGFLHVASGASGCAPSGAGWYIDDVRIAVQ